MPESELELAQEFLRNPRGPHSQALQRLLREFRGAPATGKYVLIEEEPHRRWRLGRLSGAQAGGVRPIPERCFASILEAEREVFILRWNESGRTPPLSEQGRE